MIFAHARALAKTTSASTSTTLPAHLKTSQPFPGETAMRQGILFMENGVMGGLGDVEVMPAGVLDTVDDMEGMDGGAMEEIEYLEEERRGGAGVFDLDLNSDSEDDD